MGQLQSQQRTVDTALVLQDVTTTKTSSFNGSVGGSSFVLDLGTGHVMAECIVDVSAIDVASADESYRLMVQLSDNVGFTTGTEVEGGSVALGHKSVIQSDKDSVAGRFIFAFDNQLSGATYRYARLRGALGGTTPSITITYAFLAPIV